MKNGIMLYKCPGHYFLHGIWCDYIIVLESQADQYLKQGWSLSPAEAHALLKKTQGILPPTEIIENLKVKRLAQVEEEKPRLKFSELSEFEKQSIKADDRPMLELANVHNVTYHTIRKIKGRA